MRNGKRDLCFSFLSKRLRLKLHNCDTIASRGGRRWIKMNECDETCDRRQPGWDWYTVLCLYVALRAVLDILRASSTMMFEVSQVTIAGHRHWGRCRRHRHSGNQYLNPEPEHSGTGLEFLIPVPNWFRHFCSFRYRTDWMPDSPIFRHLKRGTPGTSILLVLVMVKGIPMQCTSKLQVVKSSKVMHIARS